MPRTFVLFGAVAGAAVGAVLAGGPAGAGNLQDNRVDSFDGSQDCGALGAPQESGLFVGGAGESGLSPALPVIGESGPAEVNGGQDATTCVNGPVIIDDNR